MKLKHIMLSAILLSPLFISGCDYSHEARLNIENIQQNNTKYIKNMKVMLKDSIINLQKIIL